MAHKVMLTIVRQQDSGLFLDAEGTWTPDASQARAFRTSLDALDYCCQNKIFDAVLTLRLSNPPEDIHLHPFAGRGPGKDGGAAFS